MFSKLVILIINYKEIFMETRHFTFPNGQVTTLYKHNNGALLMDWETGRLLAKNIMGKIKQ